MSVGIVCFDLGGVLVRLCRSWDEGCLACGVEIRDRARTPNQELERRAAVESYQRGEMTCHEFFRIVARTFNGAYTPEEVERVHGAWIMREYDGAADLVHRLHDAGVRTTCLSNTNAGHWERLVTWPSVAALGSRHASHEMRLAKPDARIFRAFETSVGVAGGDILFFEDTRENANAARSVGWRAEVVDPSEETVPQITAFLRTHGVTV